MRSQASFNSGMGTSFDDASPTPSPTTPTRPLTGVEQLNKDAGNPVSQMTEQQTADNTVGFDAQDIAGFGMQTLLDIGHSAGRIGSSIAGAVGDVATGSPVGSQHRIGPVTVQNSYDVAQPDGSVQHHYKDAALDVLPFVPVGRVLGVAGKGIGAAGRALYEGVPSIAKGVDAISGAASAVKGIGTKGPIKYMPRNESWTPETSVDPGLSAGSSVSIPKWKRTLTTGAAALALLGVPAERGVVKAGTELSQMFSGAERAGVTAAKPVVETGAKAAVDVAASAAKDIKPALEVPNPEPNIAPVASDGRAATADTMHPDGSHGSSLTPVVNPAVDAATQQQRVEQQQQQQQTTSQNKGDTSKGEEKADEEKADEEKAKKPKKPKNLEWDAPSVPGQSTQIEVSW